MSMPLRMANLPRNDDVQKAQAEISRSHAQLYRPDIDGLRAVAALAVVAVHVNWLRGGLFGVDIFFVISGFLISGIIFRALQDGQFSLCDFYARRVKRIFPALIVLLTSVSVFGWIVVPSAERRYLGQEVVAGAGFAENLWMYANYRQLPRPIDWMLSHLWTLGVEEQFYLVWPLFLTMMWLLLREWRLWFMVMAAMLSFGSYIWADSWERALPWNRFWELVLGATLAYLQHTQSTGACRAWMAPFLRPPISRSLGMIGAVCIIVALFGPGLLDKAPSGGYGSLSTLGAFLLIAAGPEQWINRHVLAARPIVLIGLISYPLYLWHWSLLIFAATLHGHEYGQLPVTWRVVAIAASLVISYVTYKHIELPLRSSRNTGSIALLLCAAMAMCGIAAYFVLG